MANRSTRRGTPRVATPRSGGMGSPSDASLGREGRALSASKGRSKPKGAPSLGGSRPVGRKLTGPGTSRPGMGGLGKPVAAQGKRRPKRRGGNVVLTVLGSVVGLAGGLFRRRSRSDATGSDAPLGAAEGRRGSADTSMGVSGESIRRAIVAGIAVAALVLVCLLGFLVLSYTPLFTIRNVTVVGSEHVSDEAVADAAALPAGATLLNIDEAQVEKSLGSNPWVGSVRLHRKFPDTLEVEVQERQVGYVVVMSSGNIAWCLGSDGIWIEPMSLGANEGYSIDDYALSKASEMGAILITDVPSTVNPDAGSPATDGTIKGVLTYMETFSQGFSSNIVSFSASTEDSIGCTLATGVDISLGAPVDIETKESIAGEVLERYSDRITYLNVRVPSRPTYRIINSDTVQRGTGVAGTDFVADSTSTDVGEGKDATVADGAVATGDGDAMGDGTATGDGASAADAAAGATAGR